MELLHFCSLSSSERERKNERVWTEVEMKSRFPIGTLSKICVTCVYISIYGIAPFLIAVRSRALILADSEVYILDM